MLFRSDNTLFGIVDLSKAAITQGAPIYYPALLIVIGSAAAQYYQSKQLLPQQKDGKSLKQILKEAQDGKQADQSEMSAATGRFTVFMIPAMILFFTIRLAAALPLYWLATSVIAIIQQRKVLNQDETELEAIADKSTKNSKIIEGEVIPPKKTKKQPKKQTKNNKTTRNNCATLCSTVYIVKICAAYLSVYICVDCVGCVNVCFYNNGFTQNHRPKIAKEQCHLHDWLL